MQMFLNAIVPVISLLGIEGLAAIGVGIAALSCVGAGLGMGLSVGKSVDAIARQPGAFKQIRSSMLLGLAFCETTAIYGTFIAIMLIVM